MPTVAGAAPGGSGVGEDGVDHLLVEQIGLFEQGSVAGGVEGDPLLGGSVEKVEPLGGWAQPARRFVASFHQVDGDGEAGGRLCGS